jgi:hypothetical protein
VAVEVELAVLGKNIIWGSFRTGCCGRCLVVQQWWEAEGNGNEKVHDLY